MYTFPFQLELNLIFLQINEANALFGTTPKKAKKPLGSSAPLYYEVGEQIYGRDFCKF